MIRRALTCKWAIDHERVEAAGRSWDGVFAHHLRIIGMGLALDLAGGYYWGTPARVLPWLFAAAAVPPAIGAYHYWQEDENT